MELIEEIVLPKNWDELVAVKNIIPFYTSEVTRFPKGNKKYFDHTQKVSREEYLKNIFNEIGDKDINITPNKFPYSRLIKNIPEVKHYCMWSKNGEPSFDVIESEIKNKFPNNKYFWFINPPNNKSIPEIWHCQIFVKMK